MGKGGGGQAQETAQEKALSKVSQEKWDRYKNLYRDVEKDFIEDVNQDTSNLLKGRAIADVAQASSESLADSVQLGNGSVSNLGSTAENLGGARMTAAIGGNKQAQEITDKGNVSALRIGHDMSADVQNGLSVAARAANKEAIGKAKAQAVENEAKMSALSTLGGFAYAKYKGSKDKPTKARDSRLGDGAGPMKDNGNDWDAFDGDISTRRL